MLCHVGRQGHQVSEDTLKNLLQASTIDSWAMWQDVLLTDVLTDVLLTKKIGIILINETNAYHSRTHCDSTGPGSCIRGYAPSGHCHTEKDSSNAQAAF